MQPSIEVGVLGATGMVGQHFLKFLEGHPWFRVTWVAASDRSAGKLYHEATAWRLSGEIPREAADLTVQECRPGRGPRLVFSAMDASVAGEIEQEFACGGHVVVSNSRNHRMEPDVPLLVPEINPDHLRLLPAQQRNRGWQGMIVTNPNCATVGLTMGLGPLKPFGIRRVVATTLQAVSGAGYPGVASMDIVGNVIPFIGGEEEKMERETQKILGDLVSGQVRPLQAPVSAHCNRVPVVDGHTVTISVALENKPSLEQAGRAFQEFRSLPAERGLPSAPARAIVLMAQPDRPQPRRDAERDRGMTVFVGRLRPCPVLDYKLVSMSHNAIRGAAGGAVLNAELMHSEGLLD